MEYGVRGEVVPWVVATSYGDLLFFGETVMRGQLKEEYINHALPLPHILTYSHSHNLITKSLTGASTYSYLNFVLYKHWGRV